MESFEGNHSTVVNRLFFADHAGTTALGDAACLNLRACHHKLGKFEHFFDQGGAEGALAQFGIEKACHGFFHLIHKLVNNAEKFDLNAFAFGGIGGGVIRLGVKPDHHGTRGFG